MKFFDRKWCIMYIAISCGVFVVGAIIYGGLGALNNTVFTEMGEEVVFPLGFAAVMGGHLLMSIAGGIMLLKIVCGVLFFISFLIAALMGFFATIPMVIACIVWLARHPKSQELPPYYPYPYPSGQYPSAAPPPPYGTYSPPYGPPPPSQRPPEQQGGPPHE